MNTDYGIITSMWLNNDDKSIGLAVVVHKGLHYEVHQIMEPLSNKDAHKLGDKVLIDTYSHKLIYQ